MMMLINLIPTNMKLFRKKTKKIEVTTDDLLAVQYAYKRLHHNYAESDKCNGIIALKNLEKKIHEQLYPTIIT